VELKNITASSPVLANTADQIVFVHGINVDNMDWLIESDTVFKRLFLDLSVVRIDSTAGFYLMAK